MECPYLVSDDKVQTRHTRQHLLKLLQLKPRQQYMACKRSTELLPALKGLQGPFPGIGEACLDVSEANLTFDAHMR